MSILNNIRKEINESGIPSFGTATITGIIWHPVMTVLVRQQFAGAVEGAKQYRGIWHAATSIAREGPRSLYRGIGPRLLQSPLAAIQWTTYELFRGAAAKPKSMSWDFETAKYATLFCGSRALVTTAKCPFEILKERMQAERSLPLTKYVGLSAVGNMKILVEHEGYLGLFAGLTANLARDIPVAICMFLGNDVFTHLLTSGSLRGFASFFEKDKEMSSQGKSHSPTISLLAGGLSGAATAVLTQPIDVAKTVLQTQGLAYRAATDASMKAKYRGLWHTLVTLASQRGFSFLYTGIVARGFHLSLGAAMYLPIYRQLKKSWTSWN